MLTEGAFEYNAIDEAKNSPLVQQLFKLPFVKKVFVYSQFYRFGKIRHAGMARCSK
ncbi:MAG: NifU N-terminal domain-containing protein [Flavobacteriaceae bacterium]|nr:NifU N-terminal domain-containing protein [Flavobacteriaceae bacterium]